ncbi:unnamed protein product, partial [Prorocentrum cordatum]
PARPLGCWGGGGSRPSPLRLDERAVPRGARPLARVRPDGGDSLDHLQAGEGRSVAAPSSAPGAGGLAPPRPRREPPAAACRGGVRHRDGAAGLPALGPSDELAQGRAPQEPLFAFSQAEFARSFKLAGSRRLLQKPPPPCILRHAGASRDFAEQRRTLAGARRRGRWRTDASARRHEKGGRLGSEFAKLPERLRTHARWCLQHLPAALSGSLPPRAFGGR